ncbi:MAG: 30S ribosomal protein S9 [bacterium]|nr:30S ribosomal protein S9 [Candidatus Jorgensenbacteria bacterium]
MPPKTTKTTKVTKAGRYFEAVGRRKNAVARVRLHVTKTGSSVTINDKEFSKYFPVEKHRLTVLAPFKTLSITEYDVTVKALGGGVMGQAEAIRLGISRALIIMNPVWRTPLKVLGYLKRDPRMVERKKPGLRKARRPQQWRKR